MTDRTEQEKISDRKARGNKEGLLLCGSKARAPEEIQYKIETYQQTWYEKSEECEPCYT